MRLLVVVLLCSVLSVGGCQPKDGKGNGNGNGKGKDKDDRGNSYQVPRFDKDKVDKISKG